MGKTDAEFGGLKEAVGRNERLWGRGLTEQVCAVADGVAPQATDGVWAWIPSSRERRKAWGGGAPQEFVAPGTGAGAHEWIRP